MYADVTVPITAHVSLQANGLYDMHIFISSLLYIYPTIHINVTWRQGPELLCFTWLFAGVQWIQSTEEQNRIENKWALTINLLQLEFWNYMIKCLRIGMF